MKYQKIKAKTLKLAKQKGLVPEIEIDYSDGISWEQPITQSMLQAWFRDVHRINIEMSFKMNVNKWDYMVYDMNMNGKEYVKFYKLHVLHNFKRKFGTYEDALEHGLIESLNLLV